MDSVEVFFLNTNDVWESLFYPMCMVTTLFDVLRCVPIHMGTKQLDSIHLAITQKTNKTFTIWTHKHGFAENVKGRSPIRAELTRYSPWVAPDGRVVFFANFKNKNSL